MQAKAISRIHPEYVPGPPNRSYRPRQLALFTNTPDPIPIGIHWEPEEGEEVAIDEGLSMVKNENSSQLIISGSGALLGKKGERMIVSKQAKVIYEFPLWHMNEVIVSSKGVSVSSDLIVELCRRGIRLSFLGYTGKPFALITSPLLTVTTITRREQILAFKDVRGVELSKAILAEKLRNQGKLLLYFIKPFRKKDLRRAEKVQEFAHSINALRNKSKKVHGEKIDQVRDALKQIDVEAGSWYWAGVKLIIDQKFEFLGQVHRHAADRINSMLTYGYGLLYSQIWGALLQAGLEPFAGFMHVDQPGHSSLILDLVEEFRQPVVDRPVIAQVNLGEIQRLQDELLDSETRKSIGQKILERLESVENYEGKKYQIKSIIQIQARKLATFLRDGKKYKPFRFKW